MSYTNAIQNKWHKQIAEELGWEVKVNFWSFDDCLQEASNFSSLPEWRRGSKGQHIKAYKQGWHIMIAKKLGWKYRIMNSWDYESCKKEASKYSSLTGWSLGSSGSYKKAREEKWHKQIAENLGWKDGRSRQGT